MSRELLAADAAASFDTESTHPLVGETVDVQIQFDNAGDTVGFAPYVDVLIPADADDNQLDVSYVNGSASLLSQAVSSTILTIDETGQLDHPIATDESGNPIQITGTPGSQLMVFELPFGSYVPDEPAVGVTMQLQVDPEAEVGESIQILTNGGFRLGEDALSNPETDNPIRGASDSLEVTPQLIKTAVEYLGPEDETATGPNFVQSYRVTVDVAEGFDIQDVKLTNAFDHNQAFVGIASQTFAEDELSVVSSPVIGQASDSTNLVLELSEWTGVAGTDGTFVLDFYIPENDSSDATVIDEIAGTDNTSTFELTAGGTWVRAGQDDVLFAADDQSHVLEDQVVAVQQSVSLVTDDSASGLGPNDIVEYTLDFQVSDFASLNHLILETLVPDGQTLLAGSTFTISGIEGYNDGLTQESLTGLSLVAPSQNVSGQSYLFDVSNELRAHGLDGLLHGGLTEAGQGSAVSGSVTYRAQVNDQFTGPVASGDLSIDEGDRFDATLNAVAYTYDPASETTTSNLADDDSAASQAIETNRVSTSVYAINGVVRSDASDADVVSGDLVTYRIWREVHSSDIENLELSQYLSLPIHSVDGLTWDADSQGFEVDTIRVGSADTFHARFDPTPALTLDSLNNSLHLDYGDLDSTLNTSTMLDLYVTVAVEDSAFQDGMWLTSMSSSEQSSSNNGDFHSKAITNVRYTRPVLDIVKGVVSATNDEASLSPSGDDANVSNIDSGDIVRFQFVVSNSGQSANGAFDVRVQDVIPTGFEIPSSGLSLSITDGVGNALSYIGLDDGQDTDLFGSGLELIEEIAGSDVNDGSQQVIVQYDLQVSDLVHSGETHASSAKVTHYAAIEGGKNFVGSEISDDASGAILTPSLTHVLVTTDQTHTSGNNVVIGETATYEVTITIPEVEMLDSVLTMTAPQGVAIQELLSVTISDPISGATSAEVMAGASIEDVGTNTRNAGRILRLNLGDLVNTDRDNGADETITVTYSATVTNDAGNDAGDRRRVKAVWSYEAGSQSQNSDRIIVREPRVDVSKSWNITNIDAADYRSVTIDITSATDANAFDIQLQETLAPGVSYVEGSLRQVSGAVPEVLSDASGVPTASWTSLAPGETAQLTYDVIVNDDVAAGESLAGSTDVVWTSLPGDPGQTAASNTLAFERTGDPSDPGSSSNDYRTIATTNIQVNPVTLTKTLVASSIEETVGNALTIGETGWWDVAVTVPEGVHELDLSSLDFSAGTDLILESLELTSIGANITMLPSVGTAMTGSSDVLSFALGTVTNTPDNVDSDADQLTFRLKASVPDLETNNHGETNTLRSTVDYQNGSVSANSKVDLVEPSLALTQNLSSRYVDALDTVTVTIVADHSELDSSFAFDIDLEAQLVGSGLSMVDGSLSVSGATLTSGDQAGDSSIRVTGDGLANGDTVTITYELSVAETVAVDDSWTLPVSIDWLSADGSGRSYTTTTESTLRVKNYSFAGNVFVDHNEDGGLNGEDYGIGSVPVRLTGTDHLGNAVDLEVTSTQDGHYQFPVVRSGEYSITETQPNYVAEGLSHAGDGGGLAGLNQVTGIDTADLESGVYGNYNFAETPLTYITGTVYVDANEDGALHDAEVGIAGVEITLNGTSESGESVSRTSFTNDRGYYVFDYLDPGTYSIVEGTTEGYIDAAEQVGSQGGTVENDRFSDITVSYFDPGVGYNFGEYEPASISGTIYLDYDRDAVLDRLDGTIAGVEVVLTGTDDQGQSVTASMTTDVDGAYAFENLRPGVYSVDSEAVADLEPFVSNVGEIQGSGRNDNGTAVLNGIQSISIMNGDVGKSFNVGHVDSSFERSIMETEFDSQTLIAGSSSSDTIDVQVSATEAVVTVNGTVYNIAATDSHSIRILGSFGDDSLTFTGSDAKETLDLRKHSMTVTGTWFETRVYGMETFHFEGGGYEDLARFYDTPGEDTFTASPMTASMTGEGYANSVENVHRNYAYATTGTDAAYFVGQEGSRDNFKANSDEAKMYDGDFYNFAGGFDTVHGTATDASDRAYLHGTDGNDTASISESVTTLEGNGYHQTASDYTYTRVSAKDGSDVATFHSSDGDDRLVTYPDLAKYDFPESRVIGLEFESITATASSGMDQAWLHDSHYDDTVTAGPTEVTMINSVNSILVQGFDKVSTYMEAGGTDIANIVGSDEVDVFKAWANRWVMESTGYYLFGSGFTNVTAIGSMEDKAYLYDTAYNDLLTLTTGSATLSGQLFSNTASGFGRTTAEGSTGHDRVLFEDDALRSTVRFEEEAMAIWGNGFEHKALGFDLLDVYFADIGDTDRVELNGQVSYELGESDKASANHRLRIYNTPDGDSITLKTRIQNLS